jgi:hypothetical protein
MSESKLPFFTRLGLAFRAFFRTLSESESPAERPATSQPPARPAFKESSSDAALQLMGLLQQEGRLLDFLEEDISAFSDSEIGAAARVVHEGCRKAVRNYFTLEPVRGEQEGTRITLNEGFDASSVRLTGNVLGRPPFTGNLIHRGWRVSSARLPRVAEGHDTSIVAPAEVEL